MNNYLPTSHRKFREDGEIQERIYQTRGVLSNMPLILGVALLVTLIGSLYAMSLAPVYQANMLIQIKRNSPIVGDSVADVPAATEVEILRSRSILSRVVEALRMDVSVEPRRFPIAGAYLARNRQGVSKPGILGTGGYAWANEHAQVAALTMPGSLLGEKFVLTAGSGNGYTFENRELGLTFSGRVGVPAKVETRYGPIELLVSAMSAKPGVQFAVSRVPVFHAVDQLQQSLAIAEAGKQSNVISLSLKGSDPVLITRILNQIGNEYIRQHTSQRSNEASNALALYDRQVSESRSRLQQLDARFASLTGRHGVTDLGEESRILSQQSVTLQERLGEAEQKRAELSTRYLSEHPAMIAADQQVRNLRNSLAAVQAKRRTLAGAEQEIASVERDKQVNAELNAGLLSIRQKLDSLNASDAADVRLVDQAEVPIRPVTLGIRTMVVLALLSGLVLGVIASLLKNALAAPSRRPAVPRYDGQFRLV